MKKHKFLLLTLSISLGFNLIGQSGSKDPSFNTIDNCTYGSGESFDGIVNTIALQSDGKLLAGGDFSNYNGTNHNHLTRVNADGSIDQSFNPGSGFNGVFPSSNPTTIFAIAIQSDGKIIAGGNFLTYNGNTAKGIVRLNRDGSIDKSFNTGNGFNAPVFKILIQPDGKVIITGNFTTFNGTTNNRIIRLNTNGSQDTSFKTGTGLNNYARTLTLQNNGKILVGGIFNTYNGKTSIMIARLNKDGSFDNTFATGTGFQNEVTSIIPLSNGKMYVLGHFLSYKSSSISRAIRLDSLGNKDNTFNPGFGFDGGVYSAALQPDGKIIAVGSFTKFDNKTYNRICRINTDGTVDTNFKTEIPYIVGEYGLTTTIRSNGSIYIGGNMKCYGKINAFNYLVKLSITGGYEEDYNHATGFQVYDVKSLYVQSDQKIMAGGTFYSYNGYESACIARLKPDGTVDSTFKSSVKAGGTINLITLQSDGKILASGGFVILNSSNINFARLNTDGTVDTSFKIGKGALSSVYSSAIQSDGKIIVGGIFSTFNDTAAGKIVRLYPNGIIDKSFNTGVGFNDLVYKILIQSDGKIIACGRFTKYQNISYPGIIRLMPNGDVDSSFVIGSGISTAFPSTGIPFATSISLQSDGKIIMAGNFTKYNNFNSSGIVRMLSNGRYDSSFSVSSAFNSYPYETIIQSDGKIIATGTFTTYKSTSRNRIVRILQNGSLDATFDPGSGFDRYTRGLAFHNGERILVGGEFTKYNDACRTRITRLLNCESLSQQSVINCGPYSWVDGKTYSNSTNDPYIKLSNVNYNGCDSFIVLNLTVKQASYAEQIIKSCGSYKWIDGTTYNTSIDTVKYNIAGGAFNGCDSIISLKLTINHPTTTNYPVIACKQYKWLDGVTYTESNSTATITYPGASYNGCDSILKLSLGIKKVTTTVSKNLTFLTSNEFNATYQWLNCDSANKPINGATDRTYEALITGNYAVVVTKDDCTDTSDCIEVIVDNSSIHYNENTHFRLYPNPSNGIFTIDSKHLSEFHAIEIIDYLGRHVKSIAINQPESMVIDLSEYNGVYYIELTKDNITYHRFKLIILKD